MLNATLNLLISGLLFLWGSAYLGLVVFTFFFATAEHWARLADQGRITTEYAIYISEIPLWVMLVTIATALTRFLGGLSLLMKADAAVYLYTVSFVLTLVIMFRGFVLADVASVIRGSQIALEIVFLGLSCFAAVYAYLLITR